METNKFKELFSHAEKQFNGRNDRVVVVTNNPSVGGRCRLPVSNVNSGFDWERGDIIISVDDEMYSKNVNDFQLLSKFIYRLDLSVYEKIKESHSDAECRRILLEELDKFKKDETNKTV